ncbi:uncharacterized protein UTRI_10212 [Ustilago trichophora]|uniref:Uncharacterized protein n=1 Tax=Ustilago trichophora TaxID=86804 RepID=A0A5C3EHA8_9BASI|nr:uncharacterized protein UTRI_10212 [Ustilago trichophora]
MANRDPSGQKKQCEDCAMFRAPFASCFGGSIPAMSEIRDQDTSYNAVNACVALESPSLDMGSVSGCAMRHPGVGIRLLIGLHMLWPVMSSLASVNDELTTLSSPHFCARTARDAIRTSMRPSRNSVQLCLILHNTPAVTAAESKHSPCEIASCPCDVLAVISAQFVLKPHTRWLALGSLEPDDGTRLSTVRPTSTPPDAVVPAMTVPFHQDKLGDTRSAFQG